MSGQGRVKKARYGRQHIIVDIAQLILDIARVVDDVIRLAQRLRSDSEKEE